MHVYPWVWWLEGLHRWLSGKESAHQAGDAGSVPGSGRSPGEGNGNPRHGNPMDREAWCLQSMGPQRVGQWACMRRVWWLAQSRLNKCTHKSVKKLDLFSNNSNVPRAYLLCKVRKSSVSVSPSNYWYWQFKGIFTTFSPSCLSLFTFSLLILWIKAKHLGHESEQASGVGDGQGSLVCCSPWGLKESDTTEQLHWTKLM